MSGVVQKDLVAGWQQVTQMSMKARLNTNSTPDGVPDSTYDSLSSLPVVGYNTNNASLEKSKPKPSKDVIVLSDEEETDGPSSHSRKNGSSVSKSQRPLTTTTHTIKMVDTLSIREKLLEEERKLNMLKALKSYQSPEASVTSNGRLMGFSNTHSIATVPPPIQGSALNKSSAKSSGLRMSTLEHHGLGHRSGQSRHSIVVVPGNTKPSQQTSTSPPTTTAATGISSRLQQLVDNVAVDQALPSDKDLSRLASTIQQDRNSILKQISARPPVPSLMSISSSKSSISTMPVINHTPIKPKVTASGKPHHEVITVSHPPPLLHTSSTNSGSVIVPSVSSSTGAKNLAIMAMNKPELSDKDKLYVKQVVENSKRYRDYMLKQTHTRRSFTKQLERKILVAPYPKTFRQVWPIIPVHDSSFVANFGLEGVVNHFHSSHKSQVDKTSNMSKVKPICNQCSCDFASAWQIRKGNSKQLLLCEACDFQNLKILQRSKLANQLKELLETVRKEEEKFNSECEAARKQVMELEKQTLMVVSNKPPPLTSQLPSQQKNVYSAQSHSSVTSHVIKKATITPSQATPVEAIPVVSMAATKASSVEHHHPVIPSILGQRFHQPELLPIAGLIKSSRKRKDPPPSTAAIASNPPPSKSFKPGSVLDQTLSKLSQTLIKRKLYEHLSPTPEDIQKDTHTQVQTEIVSSQVSTPTHTHVTTEAGQTSTPGSVDSRRSRRKGTPKHKRLLSASSVTSE